VLVHVLVLVLAGAVVTASAFFGRLDLLVPTGEQVDGHVDDFDACGGGDVLFFRDGGQFVESAGEGGAQLVFQREYFEVGFGGWAFDGDAGQRDGKDDERALWRREFPAQGVIGAQIPVQFVAKAQDFPDVAAGDGGDEGTGFGSLGVRGSRQTEVMIQDWEGLDGEVEGDPEVFFYVLHAGLRAVCDLLGGGRNFLGSWRVQI